MTGDTSTPQPRLAPSPSPDWEVAPPPDDDAVQALVGALKLPRPLCAVLAVRGVHGGEDAKAFLRPLLDGLHDPEGLPDADVAAERLLQAIDSGETVLVHGDYDVDGISGTALLTRWIRRLGGRAVPFVPHRLRDGYDFGPAGLDAARAAGAALIVTVDCGITAVEPVAQARSEGLDVIVTDHHTPGPVLPDAVAVVNPSRPDATYPNPALSGTAVAFKLAQLLARRRGVADEEIYGSLDLVALATVADLVPLSEENRTLVRYGLRALAQTDNPGLRALLDRTRLAGKKLGAGQIGFVLAPRINAVGRMGAASIGLDLLMTDDPDEASRLAETLDEKNRTRQAEDRRTLDEALAMLAERYDPDRDFGVVLAAEGWHPGVIGIVASRVVERIHRPTVLIALKDGRGRGSARSISGFHLYDALDACRGHLTRFGGHKMAAGMDLDAQHLAAFRDAFNQEARTRLEGIPPRPTLRVDVALGLDEVSRDLAHYLQYLGPFGMSNRRPVFVARGVELTAPPKILKDEHLKLQLGHGRARLEGLGWRLRHRIDPDDLGLGPVDLVFQVEEREFRGRTQVQAKLLDVRRSGSNA